MVYNLSFSLPLSLFLTLDLSHYFSSSFFHPVFLSTNLSMHYCLCTFLPGETSSSHYHEIQQDRFLIMFPMAVKPCKQGVLDQLENPLMTCSSWKTETIMSVFKMYATENVLMASLFNRQITLGRQISACRHASVGTFLKRRDAI